jgi:hypothetical protein
LAGAVRLNAPHRSGPWSSSQLAGLVAGNSLAVLLAFVGWLRASGEGRAGDQIVWLNVSFAGVVVALVANGFFLARGRQTVRLATPVALTGSAPAAAAGTRRAGRVVAVTGLKRYHRPECALVTGKTLDEAQADSFAGAGLIPCEVCEP